MGRGQRHFPCDFGHFAQVARRVRIGLLSRPYRYCLSPRHREIITKPRERTCLPNPTGQVQANVRRIDRNKGLFVPQLHLATVVSKPFQENTYIAWLDGRHECLVIDPGLEPQKILDLLAAKSLTPAALLNTHGHSDHIAGNGAMKARWPACPLVIGLREIPKLSDPEKNMSAQFGLSLVSPAADVAVEEGDIYRAAGFDLLVREIPGHSSGHVVFVWQAGAPPVVFGGDVLFAGSIGRTDAMVGGNFAQLAAGIRQKLYVLPEETIVLPGHGEPTTIGEEMRTNPFVPAAEGSEPG